MAKMFLVVLGLFLATSAWAGEANFCMRMEFVRMGQSIEVIPVTCNIHQMVSNDNWGSTWTCKFGSAEPKTLETTADRIGYNSNEEAYFASFLLYKGSPHGQFLFENLGVTDVQNNSFFTILFKEVPVAPTASFVVKTAKGDHPLRIAEIRYGMCDL